MQSNEQGYAGTHEMNEALKDRFKNTTLRIDYNEANRKKNPETNGIHRR